MNRTTSRGRKRRRRQAARDEYARLNPPPVLPRFYGCIVNQQDDSNPFYFRMTAALQIKIVKDQS